MTQKRYGLLNLGFISLFATEVKDEELVGERAERGVQRHRRYLFSVDALEALFGAVLDNPKSFLAVAIEATELSQITIADLGAQIAVREASATAIVENWR